MQKGGVNAVLMGVVGATTTGGSWAYLLGLRGGGCRRGGARELM